MSAIARARFPRAAWIFLNLLASVQFVWFYLSRVRSCMDIQAYELGRERIPFQYRLLLMFPLRWAHQWSWLQQFAAELTASPGWFPTGVRAEGLVEAVIDMMCVIVIGVMACRLYQLTSRSLILAPFLYPLTLVMMVGTYCLLTMHSLRFIYDLPSVAFFSTGLVLILERKHPFLFIALFVVATLNRETTLLLLVFYLLAECRTPAGFAWRRALAPRTLSVILPLALFWIGWHAYVVGIYAGNKSENKPRLVTNLGLLMVPLAWPQLAGACGYLWPLVLAFRSRIQHPVIRAWLWVLPAWIAFMLYYGLFIEIRIFGELIPYFACASALIFEETLIARANTLLPQPVLLAEHSASHAN